MHPFHLFATAQKFGQAKGGGRLPLHPDAEGFHPPVQKIGRVGAKNVSQKRLLLDDDVKLYVKLARKRDIGIE